MAERFAAVGELIAAHPDEVDPVVRGIILGAQRWSPADMARSLYELARLRRGVDKIWDPSTSGPADDFVVARAGRGHHRSGRRERRPGPLYQRNQLCDLCAVTIPGRGDDPGVSILGPAWADARVAEIAARLDARTAGSVWLAVVGAHLQVSRCITI